MRRSELAFCTLVFPLTAFLNAAPLSKDAILTDLIRRGEQRWTQVSQLYPGMGSRDIYGYALTLCEANVHLDRLERLLEVAARMQDRDKESRGYGNFRWNWEDGSVLDHNAVEFCMQRAVVLRLKHWDRLSERARALLSETFDYAVEGCLRHRVTESYTNIALMNAQNLVLLGEVLGRKDVLQEGKRRLDNICSYTWECGTHEYCSPTYYGVDLECLMMMLEFAKEPVVLQQAEALFRLFWLDLAANWFAPSQRLGGTRSRDYDYLRGLGLLDDFVWAAGWLPGDLAGKHGHIMQVLSDAGPDRGMLELNRTLYPRLVEQSYGLNQMDFRTHYVLPSVSLSCSGSQYGAMDLPLCVDFASDDRNSVRGYFIPDARRDPYGKKRIPAGGGHEKTLHLRPFWAGVQRENEALGLVIYRTHDYPANPASLESHFVFPADVDELFVGDVSVDMSVGIIWAKPLPVGQSICMRRGGAVVGIRVLWGQGMDGAQAQVAVVRDGNLHGAARLTVAHHSYWGVSAQDAVSGAAFWIRVADGLDDDAFAKWRQEFGDAAATGEFSDGTISVSAKGLQGPLSLVTGSPFMGCMDAQPAPEKIVLAVNGEDRGRQLLSSLEIVKKREERVKTFTPIPVAGTAPTRWEAERGLCYGSMVPAEDNEAFGGKFVWTPGAPGERGGSNSARVYWKLAVEKPGLYYLWGRISAPTQDDDSFLVRIRGGGTELVPSLDWHTGVHEQWEWAPLTVPRASDALGLRLPAGEVELEIRCREDGTKIDQLLLTLDSEFLP